MSFLQASHSPNITGILTLKKTDCRSTQVGLCEETPCTLSLNTVAHSGGVVVDRLVQIHTNIGGGVRWGVLVGLVACMAACVPRSS